MYPSTLYKILTVSVIIKIIVCLFMFWMADRTRGTLEYMGLVLAYVLMPMIIMDVVVLLRVKHRLWSNAFWNVKGGMTIDKLDLVIFKATEAIFERDHKDVWGSPGDTYTSSGTGSIASAERPAEGATVYDTD